MTDQRRRSEDWTVRERVLAHGLWDCMVAAGADVSDYCISKYAEALLPEPLTVEERLETGFEQWLRMRLPLAAATEAVEVVTGLRNDYEDEAEDA